MKFDDMVLPLIAPKLKSDDYSYGSGFLARRGGQTYLVTVAHLANYQLAPSGDWSVWAEKLFLVGESLEVDQEYALFHVDNADKRTPRFKYSWRYDVPGHIQDVILLPLLADDPILNSYRSFELDQAMAPHAPGTTVTMLGRRDEFPALSAAEHTLTSQAGPVRFMRPEGRPGDSGGPVVNAEGCLLGMNVGTHRDLPEQAMLISVEAIAALTRAIDGIAEDWPTFPAHRAPQLGQ